MRTSGRRCQLVNTGRGISRVRQRCRGVGAAGGPVGAPPLAGRGDPGRAATPPAAPLACQGDGPSQRMVQRGPGTARSVRTCAPALRATVNPRRNVAAGDLASAVAGGRLQCWRAWAGVNASSPVNSTIREPLRENNKRTE